MSKQEKIEYIWSPYNRMLRVKGTQIYVREIGSAEWEAAFEPTFASSAKASTPDVAVRKLRRRECARLKHTRNITRSKRRLNALL